ncbi:MAG: hypothetical protein JSU73_05905 [candidate division WOR-3 bacterium]|nr:MAG: hypothetical protein JSU73_05905 [candidate division WOR-3 bacterium]
MRRAVLAIYCLAAVASAHVFQRTYGGEIQDYGYFAGQPREGGYIMVGKTESYGAGDFDVWLVRTDESGDTLWTRTYGGPDYDVGWWLAQTPDDGYIIAANTKSFGSGDWDAWLIRTDKYGDSVWTRTLGGAFYENIFSVLVTSDSGYFIAGYADSSGAGDTDLWLVRTNENGDTMWTRTYGGPNTDVGHSVQPTADGGYIIAGSTQPFGASETDVWLLKTDSLGDTAWTRTYGDSSSDHAYRALPTPDDGFVVVGFTASFGAGGWDVWLLKTDSVGDTAWTRTFGSSGRDLGYSVDVTADSGYIIVGFTGSPAPDCWLIKTDGDGDMLWFRTFGGLSSDAGRTVEQTADGGYIIGGYTSSYGAGWDDFWLIKTDSAGLLAVEEPRCPSAGRAAAATIVSGTLRCQPTASSPLLAAELHDITGRKVMELRAGENDIRHLAPGVYFVKEEGPRIEPSDGTCENAEQGSEGSAGGLAGCAPSVRKIVIQR